MKKYLIAIFILITVSTVYAEEISKDTLTKRLAELEKAKIQLEQAYAEVIGRINELKYLLEGEKIESVQPSEKTNKPGGE